MAVNSANLKAGMIARETIAFGVQGLADPTMESAQGATDVALSPTSTPAVTKVWAGRVTLSSGAATLDLAALDRGAELSDLNLSGLKVQAIGIFPASANTALVDATAGASNGYGIFGAGNTRDLFAGGRYVDYSPEGLADVGGAAKEIDFSSSDGDAIVDVVIYAG